MPPFLFFLVVGLRFLTAEVMFPHCDKQIKPLLPSMIKMKLSKDIQRTSSFLYGIILSELNPHIKKRKKMAVEQPEFALPAQSMCYKYNSIPHKRGYPHLRLTGTEGLSWYERRD